MRFSLLAGFVAPDSGSGFVKIRLGNGPTVYSRIKQFVIGVLFSQMIAIGLAFLVLCGLVVTSNDPDTFATDNPELFQLTASLVIVLAPVLSTLCQLYGVYLAQLMGLLIGLAAASLLCVARVGLDLPMSPIEWGAVPLSAALSFIAGLFIGGKLPVIEEFHFKPIDSWDRNAKPSERELPGDVNKNWLRVLIGIFVGWASWHGISGLLYMIFHSLIKNQSLLEVALLRVEMPLHAVGCLAAGMIAGSSNRAGAVPGLIVGTVIFLMVQFFEPAATMDGTVIQGLLTVVPGWIGGMLGRRIFRPNLIFGNARHLPAPLATGSATGRS
ncbi:hypothetical protein K2X85_06765 [bacterium]|nr:hypothetical protein [bacterium]